MKITNIHQCVEQLGKWHRKIEQKEISEKVIDKISRFIDENEKFFNEDIKAIIELNAIAVIVKNGSINDEFIQKIRSVTHKILPEDPKNRSNTMSRLNQAQINTNGRSINDWIELMQLPLDELSLSREDLLNLLKCQITDAEIQINDNKTLDSIVIQLKSLNRPLKSMEKKILSALLSTFDSEINLKKRLEIVTEFDLTDQEDIKKILPQGFVGQIVSKIKDFGINDQATLVKIAMICAKEDANVTAKNIKKFNIKDQKALVEIAMQCTENKAKAVAKNIKKFKIKDKEEVLKIAKKCAEKKPWVVARFISNFGIEDQKALVGIAKLCAERDPRSVSEYISNFEIKDQKALVEIALCCAKEDPESVSENITRFRIEDEKDRVEIAIKCAEKGAHFVTQYIRGFGIKNQKPLVEIAVRCAERNPELVSRYIRNFPIEDQEVLIKIAGIIIDALKCPDNNKIWIKHLFDSYFSQSQSILQRSQIPWFIESLANMANLNPEALKLTRESNIFDHLMTLRDPKLRNDLTEKWFKIAASEIDKNSFDHLFKSLNEMNGMKLLAIPLCALMHQGVDPEKINRVIKKISSFQRDAVKVRQVLELILLLSSSDSLNLKQADQALDRIFLQSDTDAQLQKNIMAAKALLRIKDSEWVSSNKSIQESFYSKLQQLVPMKKFKGDPVLSYETTFGSSRFPEALLIYAATLRHAGDPEIQECLGQYVVSVFDHMFLADRYNENNNPHLTTIYRARPDLKAKWGNCRGNLQVELKNEQSTEKMFNADQWLDAVLNSDDAEQMELTFVRRCIHKSEREQREIQNELTQEIKNYTKGKMKKDLDTDAKFLNLKLQFACVQLLTAPNPKPVKCMEEIKKWLTLNQISNQFTTAVQDLLVDINSRKKDHSENESINAVISDDPIDLLLCGTEVTTCQSIDSSSSVCHGLLGYIMDGKNKLLVVKDKNGKIVARALISLVWDGKKPVLYRETFYPTTITKAQENALNDLAKSLSKAMDVPLTGSDDQGQPYGHELQTFGGPAPYEYSDSARRLTSKGKFTIRNAVLLYDPKSLS